MASIRDLADAIIRMEGSMLPGSVNMTMVTRYGLWNVGHLVWANQRNAVPVTINGRAWAGWPTYDEAYAGLVRQIQLDTSRGLTLSQFIAKYAPPHENRTATYVANVGAWTGIPAGTRLADVLEDWRNPTQAPASNSRQTTEPASRGGSPSSPPPATESTSSRGSADRQVSGSLPQSSEPWPSPPPPGTDTPTGMPLDRAGLAQNEPEGAGGAQTMPGPSPARSGPILAAQRAALARFLIRLARWVSGDRPDSGV